MGADSARALPPRLDPRAGRPPKAPSGSSARGNAPQRPPRPGDRSLPVEAGVRRGATAAPRPSARDAAPAPRFGSVLGLTALGALLPGTALIAAGARRVGWALLGVTVLGLVGLVALATVGRHQAVQWAVDPTALLGIMVAAVAVAVVWPLVIIAGYRMLAPLSTTRPQHLVGSFVVTLLALGVAMPAFKVLDLASDHRDLIQNVFADGESATVEDTGPNAFAGKDRVNVLLLGGDGGEGREGVRTDTVMVASIKVSTGATTLFSLPRNLEELPFPADSPLAEVYPDGFDAGSESESLLNAVYRNGPSEYPDILGPTDNPGADFLKLGVGEALGLHLDYYVLVNLDGFSALVDALGGITVNVNYWVPISGEPTLGILPTDYIEPGPNQRMDGERALHFARGRFGLSDYLRMDRQRCVMSSIVAAADPMTMLLKYQELAATTQDIVSTDIPSDVLDDFADLAFKVKDSGMNSVVFDDKVIRPAYPDFDLIRSLVQQSLSGPPPAPTPAPSAGGAGAPAPDGSASSGSGAGAAAGSGSDTAASGSTGAAATPADDVTDACAYDAEMAEESLAEGEPPTSR